MAGIHGTDHLGTGAHAHERLRTAPRRRWAVLGLGLAAVAAVAGLSACEPIVPADCTVEWVGPASGDWDEPANWSTGIPDVTDVACAPAGHTIRIDDDVVVASVAVDGTLELETGSLTLTRRDRTSRFATLDLAGGRLGGTTIVEVSTLRWTGGTIDGESLLTAGSATVSGTAELGGARQIWLTGPSTLTGTLAVCDTASIRNLASSSMTDLTISGAGCPVASPKVLENRAPGAISILGEVTSTVALDNQSDVSLQAGSELAAPGFTQTAGTTTVGAGAELRLPIPLALAGGRLEGTGTVAATVTGAGLIAPGPGLGTLTITGDLLPASGASIELGIAGASAAGTHDQVTVTGNADVRAAGLTVTVTTSDQPVSGQTFDLVTAAAYTGPPSTVSLPTDVFLLAGASGLRAQASTCDPNVYYPGVDLSFEDLSGVDLHGCDLSGADLADADLSGAILDGANLDGTDLTWANLELASAIGATFHGATMSGTDIAFTDFTDADLTNAAASNTSPPTNQTQAHWNNTTCPNGITVTLGGSCANTFTGLDCPTNNLVPFANLTNCNLTGRDLSGLDLADADLSGAILDGANLDGTDLTWANLELASAIGATFHGATMSGTDIAFTDFTDADLTNAAASNTSPPTNQTQAHWNNTTCPNGITVTLGGSCANTFTGLDCPTNNLVPFANLTNCNLTGRDLSGLDLADADLSGAILDGANLDGTDLTWANLELASAIGATFHGATMSGTDIAFTDFTNADLTNATADPHPSTNQTQAHWNNTTCPNGLDSDNLPNGCAGTFTGLDCPTNNLVPFANLTNCNLTGRDLSGLDLADADLSGAILDGANLDGTDLTWANLELASAIGATFHGATMSGTDIAFTDFTNADLTNATADPHPPTNQTQAHWNNTTCPNGLDSDNLPNGCAGTFTGLDCPTNNLVPFANLTNCNLTGRDLSGLDLADADLSGAILDGANLDGTDLTWANLELASAIGATFHGATMSGTDIAFTDFTNADLTNAAASNTSPPTNQTQAHWNNTTCPNGLDSDNLPNGCAGTFVVSGQPLLATEPDDIVG